MERIVFQEFSHLENNSSLLYRINYEEDINTVRFRKGNTYKDILNYILKDKNLLLAKFKIEDRYLSEEAIDGEFIEILDTKYIHTAISYGKQFSSEDSIIQSVRGTIFSHTGETSVPFNTKIFDVSCLGDLAILNKDYFYKHQKAPYRCGNFNRKGNLVMTYDHSENLKIYSLTRKIALKSQKEFTINKIDFGETRAIGFKVKDVETLENILYTPCDVNCVNFYNKEENLVLYSDGLDLNFLDLRNHEIINSLRDTNSQRSFVKNICVSENFDKFLTHSDFSIKLWDISGLIFELYYPTRIVNVSLIGNRVVVFKQNGKIDYINIKL